jgi:hypothetical protein
MKKISKCALVLIVVMMAVGSARADPVTEWNDIVSRTIFPPAPSPALRPAGASPLLDFAMVHAAIHDAVQAYEKRFRPYAVHIRDASGSRVAAVGRAARDVLVNRFPAQAASIETEYQLFLTRHRLTEADEGTFVGAHAAAAIIALRAGDGSFPTPPPPPDLGGRGAGQWRPTPPALAPFSTPWLGAVEPFTMDFNAQFRARPQPALTSLRYARDYNEVKALGGPVGYPGVTRTPEQTQIAFFWSGNTIALFEGMVRGLVEACEMGTGGRHCKSLNRLGDSARLFALANLAAADAGIRAWNSKKNYNFWRPITAIQQLLPEDNDGNPLTTADPTWTPLIATPPYPDYTSGANNLSGSFTTIVTRFFDADKVTFKVTSTAPQAVPNVRTYNRFSDLADEVVDARIFLGIHFRSADTAARREGTRVARQAFNHFLRPVHDRGHDHDKECVDHDDDDNDNDDHGRGGERDK